VGGAQYTAEKGIAGFYVAHDCRNGTPGLGARLYTLNTAAPGSGWQRRADLPSTARWVHLALDVKVIMIPPLYVSFVILYTNYTGWRQNNFNVHPSPRCTRSPRSAPTSS
jgi:hypothetical protein